MRFSALATAYRTISTARHNVEKRKEKNKRTKVLRFEIRVRVVSGRISCFAGEEEEEEWGNR